MLKTHRVALSSGASYYNAHILDDPADNDRLDFDVPNFWGDEQIVVVVPQERKHLIVHKDTVGIVHLNQKIPPFRPAGCLDFQQLLVSGDKSYGPGYICYLDDAIDQAIAGAENEAADTGGYRAGDRSPQQLGTGTTGDTGTTGTANVAPADTRRQRFVDETPYLPCFEKQVIFVTAEGTFLTDHKKISAIIPVGAGGLRGSSMPFRAGARAARSDQHPLLTPQRMGLRRAYA